MGQRSRSAKASELVQGFPNTAVTGRLTPFRPVDDARVCGELLKELTTSLRRREFLDRGSMERGFGWALPSDHS